MPVDLGQVLGGILAGIAEARSLGDRYSRVLAVEYDKDELMRAFPVPRAEFANIELEMRLAIDDTESKSPPPIASFVDSSASIATEAVVNALRDLGTRRKPSSLEKSIKPIITRELAARTAVAVAMPLPGKVQAFDTDSIILSIVSWLKEAKLTDLASGIQEPLKKLLEPARVAHEEGVGDLRAQGLFSGKTLQVRIAHTELADLRPDILSSVKLTINLRNYEWTQVDVKDGEPVHKLVPD